MSSDRSDLWAGIGAIASSIVSAYAWLYSIGLVPLFTFIAGVCFTIYAQERLEKKRRKRNREIKLTEHIYGPLHKELNTILEYFKGFQLVSGASLYLVMNDYRFNLVKEVLSRRIKEFHGRLLPYTSLLNEAYRETETYILKGSGKHKIEGNVTFRIRSAGRDELVISMIEAIFRDNTPLDYLAERASSYKHASIIAYIQGKSQGTFSNEHRIHQFSLDILREVRKDPLVQEYRKKKRGSPQRMQLAIRGNRKRVCPLIIEISLAKLPSFSIYHD